MINESEMICDKCHGLGYPRKSLFPCQKCKGTGKVDWIENIVGKKSIEGIPTQQAVRSYINQQPLRKEYIYVIS